MVTESETNDAGSGPPLPPVVALIPRILFALHPKVRGVQVASGSSPGGLYGGWCSTEPLLERGGGRRGVRSAGSIAPRPPPPRLRVWGSHRPRWERGGSSKRQLRTHHCPPVAPAFTSRRLPRGEVKRHWKWCEGQAGERGGGGARGAEGICRWVPRGARTCAPLEGGVLHLANK